LKILYFAPIDWDFIYQRPQHLAERLSLKNDFIYIQPFGLRNLTFLDIRRVFHRFRKLFKRQKGKDHLYIKDLFFIPIIDSAMIKLNSFLLRCQIAPLVDPKTIIWVTYPSPLIPGIQDGIKYGALVYEIIDDYPNIHHSMETWLVNKANLVITTSEALAEKAKKINRGVRVKVIRNGVDYDFFNNVSKIQHREFKDLEKIIGYMGMINEFIDFELLNYLADNRPDLNFVFVGPIKTKRLPLKKNIRFTGVIDYRKVPTYCNEFDVCLIPFQRGEFADAINPVKLYEYLALGKPVVSYYMRELTRYEDLIYLAKDKEDFLNKVDRALNERDNGIRELRKDIARKNDWTMISEMVGEELLRLVSP